MSRIPSCALSAVVRHRGRLRWLGHHSCLCDQPSTLFFRINHAKNLQFFFAFIFQSLSPDPCAGVSPTSDTDPLSGSWGAFALLSLPFPLPVYHLVLSLDLFKLSQVRVCGLDLIGQLTTTRAFSSHALPHMLAAYMTRAGEITKLPGSWMSWWDAETPLFFKR